jgi:hypothetical protein
MEWSARAAVFNDRRRARHEVEIGRRKEKGGIERMNKPANRTTGLPLPEDRCTSAVMRPQAW